MSAQSEAAPAPGLESSVIASSAVVNPFAQRVQPYAIYALAILIATQFFNYVDRQIVSVIAESMKIDLGLTDAQLGFLLGTSFAVLYGVVGIAAGRICDAMSRTRLMGLGLAFWSAMTVLCGMAGNFTHLALARIGVGVGEAVANPCTNSLATEYFPKENRAMALGALLVGIYVGTGFSLLIGGVLLEHWSSLCRLVPIGGACGLKNWKAAFLVVGLPGLALALLVSNLREPPRVVRRALPLWKLVLVELSAAMPPFTLISLAKAGGARAVAKNLLLLAVLIPLVILLGRASGDWAQWIAVAIGTYSVASWSHSLALRDRPLFMLTYGCPTFSFSLAGMSLIGCINTTVKVWVAVYAMRKFAVDAVQAGLYLGLGLAASAGAAVVLGGWLTDIWKQHDARAPMWMCMVALIGPIPALLVMMAAPSFPVFVVAFVIFGLASQVHGGAVGALAQDLALPRMRGAAAAAFSLVAILVGSGIGPFWVGKVSTITQSLTVGILSLLVLVPISALLLILAARRLPQETPESRIARASRFGEPSP